MKVYCKNCGKELNNEERFCTACGASVQTVEIQKKNEGHKKEKKKRNVKAICGLIMILLLTLVMVLQNVSVLPLLPISGMSGKDKGYEEPKKMAEAFVKALSNKDFDGALELFASHRMAEQVNVEAYMAGFGVLPKTGGMFPTEDPFFEKASIEMNESNATRQIINLCLSLQAGEKFFEEIEQPGLFITKEGAKKMASDWENAYSSEAIGKLQLERIDYSNPDKQKQAAKADFRLKTYDADEVAEYTVLYKCGGETYCGGLSMIRFDKKWYIIDLSAPLAGTHSDGRATSASEKEYLQMAGVEK